MNWWEKEPLRIIEISNSFDFDTLSLQEEANSVKRLGGNVQHFHCMLHTARENDSSGINETSFFFETKAAERKNPDRLKQYLPLAHKAGIKVVVYFNVHWYTKNFGKKHPGWQQIKEDGKPIDNVYNTSTSCCINSSYREWVFQILKDLCKYEIDGIFYDGPVFFANTCYCPNCKRLFKEKTGEEIPCKSDHQHSLWKELIRFQADSIGKFLSESNTIIKEINPQVLLYMNGNNNWPCWPTGRDNHTIIQNTDMLGAEGGFIYGDLNQMSVYDPGITGKLLSRQSTGKPTVVFDCAGHKNWSWYLLPEREISILLAETIAHGTNFWLAIFPDDLSQPALNTVTSYSNLIKYHPEAFFKTDSLARVGFLWPSHSAEFYSGSSVPLTDFTKEVKGEEIGHIRKEFYGLYEGLARAHVPFDVLDEKNLEDLRDYELLILPNAACLSEKDCNSIRAFVENGGNIIAGFETSLYDEYGKRKDDFQLCDVFGVSFAGEIFGPMTWDYITPSSNNNTPLLENITQKYIPSPTYGIKVKETTGRALLNFCTRLKGCYEHTPHISKEPFLVVNRYGKGKGIYLAGTFGMSLFTFHFPEYLTLIKNLVWQVSQPQVVIENAPWVEISLRKKADKVFLHLINHTSGLKRPLSSIHPLVDVKIKLFNFKAKEGYALRSGKKLLVTKKSKEYTVFNLPNLKDYEVVVFT